MSHECSACRASEITTYTEPRQFVRDVHYNSPVVSAYTACDRLDRVPCYDEYFEPSQTFMVNYMVDDPWMHWWK